ncbi:MAG: LamG domain-containing protein, partial [Verrucomicrobiales bacterium]|nr:LamG domain-containing protein [Verrucomicrobiales bacterium]
MKRKFLSCLPLFALCLPTSGQDAATRTSEGLQTLYDFSSANGDVIRDKAGDNDLKIGKPNAVKRASGSLEITASPAIRSVKPMRGLVEAVRKSGEFTIEAWIRPANTSQEGPARIVSLSKDANSRNFTLGQEKSKWDVRFLTTQTGRNGTPSLFAGGLNTELTHVVYTQENSGRIRLFVNGKTVADRKLDGDTSNWEPNLHLALGDEHSGSRLWKGTF